MEFIKEALRVLAILNILSFAWSVKGVFHANAPKSHSKYYTMVAVSLITYVVTLMSVFQSPLENDYVNLPCLLLMTITLSVFWKSVSATKKQRLSLVFSLDQPTFLVTDGPYAYVRNPFYFSYLLFYTSAFVATQNLWLAMCIVVLALIYGIAISEEEKKFKESPLADEYENYAKRVPRILPKLFPQKFKS